MPSKTASPPSPPPDLSSKERLLAVLERANQIASKTGLNELLNQMLDLILEVSGANAGTLYLLDEETNELVFEVVKGDDEARALVGKRISTNQGVIGATIRSLKPILVDDLTQDPRWLPLASKGKKNHLKNALSIPLLLEDKPIGAVQIFNFSHYELELIQLLGNRMASEVDKAMLLHASQTRSDRLQALVEIIGHIGSTLDRDQILRLIVNYARQLLDVEACSLFLVDDETQDIVLHISSNLLQAQVRVPSGKGIIGHVVRTGETVIVTDVETDQRHYGLIDLEASFKTHSIMAVPLRARTIALGRERGATEERIIGGLEAINKQTGAFTKEDAQLLETLARQAATVGQIAQAYAEVNELFFDVIQALSAAIDAKDPYTQGHSQRVSDFSVEIAKQLRLSPEVVHHIRIGAILHDVGKIGVPDSVLNKPGRLTTLEYDLIKEHPQIGERIMGHIKMLQNELPALTEHHERLNGSGYPRGLKLEQISLMGRIVAVADVFDALTSDRTYRDALVAEEAFQVLHEGMGTQFEPLCVQALIRAYNKGKIHTQKEREQGSPPPAPPTVS